MVLRNLVLAIAGVVLLLSSALSMADEYQPKEFLGLDLSKALLSPKPLGPPAEFAPVPVQADTESTNTPAEARAEHEPSQETAEQEPPPETVAHQARGATRRTGEAHRQAAKPRAAARTKLARRHGNPLDARATDTRIQVWPCKSGGICNWRPQAN